MEVINPKDVAEGVEFVLEDWPAERTPVIVVCGPRERAWRTIEKVARSQRADTVELIRRAMKVIRSRLQADVGHRASDATKFGQIVAGTYVDCLNCLRRRHVDLQQAGALVVIHPLDLKVVEQPRLAIDLGGQGVLCVEKCGVLPVSAGCAGN